MKKFLLCIFVGSMLSMYFFHFTFTFFPYQNTKNILGAVGLVMLLFHYVKKGQPGFPKDVLITLILSALISVVGFFSTVYNNTSDMAYATYIVSAIIWMSGAFAIMKAMRAVHGHISFRIVVNYLAAISVFQCVMALLIEGFPGVQQFVDTWISQGQNALHDMNRLYGIGASLDTAGCRFSIVLVLIFAMLRTDREDGWQSRQWFYLISLAIITVVGNMIARTTLVGLIVGLVYYLATSDVWKLNFNRATQGIWGKTIIVTFVFVLAAVILYNTSPMFYRLLRFGFEGFFNLAETGEWNVGSNDTLKSMIVFPETLKTWVIGDGYFSSPNSDTSFLGELEEGGFYKGTDIGYLRFIFYFGLTGLSLFIALLTYAAGACGRLFKGQKLTCFAVLIVGLVIWGKVATDIFLIFAIYLCAGNLHIAMDKTPDEEPEPEE